MAECIVTSFCEYETLPCLMCNIITGIAPKYCNECSPSDGFMSINGIDACGDVIRFRYDPENMLLTIAADEDVIDRHMKVLKVLLHYPELFSVTGCDDVI